MGHRMANVHPYGLALGGVTVDFGRGAQAKEGLGPEQNEAISFVGNSGKYISSNDMAWSSKSDRYR